MTKKVVFSFGRINPPTTGHEKLIKHVKGLADKEGADHLVVASHSQDAKKNPLTPEQKKVHLARAFPNTNIQIADKENPTFMHHLRKLHSQGYSHVTMVAGSDRVPDYQKIVNQYNGPGKDFNFKSIKVVSAGNRDPDAEGTEGMSASKMREHAKNNDLDSFKKGLPKHMSHEHATDLFNDVRGGMKLKESAFIRFKTFFSEAFISEGIHDPAKLKAIFLAGGPGSGKSYVSKNVTHGLGFKQVNSDDVFEKGMARQGMKSTPENIYPEKGQSIRDRAKANTKKRSDIYAQNKLGMVIDGTGKDPEKIKAHSEHLRSLGYDTHMIFVNTDLNTAKKRNRMRDRSLPDEHVEKMWHQTQNNIGHFQKHFGDEHFTVVDNSKDDSEHLHHVHKKVRKIAAAPVRNPVGKKWIESQGKK